MKLLSLLVVMCIITSCASVNKEKSNVYEKMLDSLRQGEIETAISIIDGSSFDSFDFYVISEHYQNPIKFVGVKKDDVLNGLRSINQTLKSCRGNPSCFEDLNWSSAKWFYDYSHKLGLNKSHLHNKYNVTVFDGEVNNGSSSWRSSKKYNYREMLSNYKKKTDEGIKKQTTNARMRKKEKLTKELNKKMSNANFRKCLTSYLVDYNEQALKVIHRNYDVALNTKHGRRNEEITKKAYSIEVKDAENNISKYNQLLSAQKGGSLDDCKKQWPFIERHRLDLERILNNR